MNRDLTVGKPARVLWQYCMPLFGSVIFQQLYNLADSFVAGKFIGEEAAGRCALREGRSAKGAASGTCAGTIRVDN